MNYRAVEDIKKKSRETFGDIYRAYVTYENPFNIYSAMHRYLTGGKSCDLSFGSFASNKKSARFRVISNY